MTATISPLSPWFAARGASFHELDGLSQVLRVSDAGQEYQAAREGLLLADGADRAALHMHGKDVLEFLQRLTSNDTRKLEVGGYQWSAMLDGKGHWIADFLIYRLPDREDGGVHLLLDMPQAVAPDVAQRIEMSHFTEDVRWEAFAGARLLLLGPKASGPTEEDCAVQGEHLWIRRPDRGTICWECLCPPEQAAQLADQLLAAGAVPGGLVALDILRVESWRPRFGTDYDTTGILPAANEWQRVSLHKGCYVGQEVVARINTYGEAPRQLVRLLFDGPPQPLTGAELHLEDRAIGQVSSWVWSPMRDQAIGLGTVRRKGAIEGQELIAKFSDEQGPGVRAVVELPEKKTDDS